MAGMNEPPDFSTVVPRQAARDGELAPAPLPMSTRVPGQRRRFRAGDSLYWQGEEKRPGFVVESGWIALELDTGGERLCIVDFILAGDILASPAALRRRSGHTARCLTDVVVRSVTRQEIASAVDTSDSLGQYRELCTSCRLFRAQDHIANMVTRDSYGRVAHLLYGLYCRATHDGGTGAAGEIVCPLRLRHIGAITGLSTVQVSRTLGRLASRGVLSLKSSRLVIVDRPQLEHEAGLFEADLADPVFAQPPD